MLRRRDLDSTPFRARSSVDQSEGLLIPRSQVRILPGPFQTVREQAGCCLLKTSRRSGLGRPSESPGQLDASFAADAERGEVESVERMRYDASHSVREEVAGFAAGE